MRKRNRAPGVPGGTSWMSKVPGATIHDVIGDQVFPSVLPSTRYPRPGDVPHCNRTSPPGNTTGETALNCDSTEFGFVPAWNSFKSATPSPSVSVVDVRDGDTDPNCCISHAS